jgi:hypothetical protein
VRNSTNLSHINHACITGGFIASLLETGVLHKLFIVLLAEIFAAENKFLVVGCSV